MPHILIFGLGYSASRLASRLNAMGWQVSGTSRQSAEGVIAFDDETSIRSAIASATHILSSVPPAGDGDPVLLHYGRHIAASPARWIGYLSSTGVYGDCGGGYVDESAPVGSGRRSARTAADLGWQTLRDDVRVFRLPGIYGPQRSPLERVAEGRAHRIDLPAQVFSRIHVDDLADGIMASFSHGPAGIYNLADDYPCGQNEVISYAAALLGVEPPPMLSLEDAGLSPQALAFYRENRRVANGKARRRLGWRPRHSTYREGLRSLLAER